MMLEYNTVKLLTKSDIDIIIPGVQKLMLMAWTVPIITIITPTRMVGLNLLKRAMQFFVSLSRCLATVSPF